MTEILSCGIIFMLLFVDIYLLIIKKLNHLIEKLYRDNLLYQIMFLKKQNLYYKEFFKQVNPKGTNNLIIDLKFKISEKAQII